MGPGLLSLEPAGSLATECTLFTGHPSLDGVACCHPEPQYLPSPWAGAGQGRSCFPGHCLPGVPREAEQRQPQPRNPEHPSLLCPCCRALLDTLGLHSMWALERAKKEMGKIFSETGEEREGNATGSSTCEGCGGSSHPLVLPLILALLAF